MIYLLRADTRDTRVDTRGGDALTHKNVRLLPLLEIRFHDLHISQSDIASFDYILFTSKNAIKSIAAQASFNQLKDKPALCISCALKKLWLDSGGASALSPSDFCEANGFYSGKQFARLISPFVAGARILYLCGSDRATDFGGLLGEAVVREVVVYSSIESAPDKSPHAFDDKSIFIFGSPKHYKTFCKHYGWNQSWLAISLGDTTFEAFSKDIQRLNAKGDFTKAIEVASAICNSRPS